MDPTERVQIGAGGPSVTRLGLGTAPLGGLYEEVSTEAAVATVRRAYELGVRLFDTAPLYGHGLAETRLGAALADLPTDELTICTKVGRLLRQAAPEHTDGGLFKGTPPLLPQFDFSSDGVRRSLEESCERLGVDRVDVVHIHDPDDHPEAALSEAFPALDRLRSEGTIGAVGAGMNQTAMLARFAEAAAFDCFLVAGRYSLLDQSALDELLPHCTERGISLVVGGVYNSGVLADPRPGAPYDYRPASDEVLARARRLAGACERHGVPLKAAAVQFPLGHPSVAAAVVGARTPEEVAENVEMFRHPVPPVLWDELRNEELVRPDAPLRTAPARGPRP